MREIRNAYKILVGKPEGRKQLGKLRRLWEDNINVHHVRMSTGFTWFRIGTSDRLL
jgi:hypothetical protein